MRSRDRRRPRQDPSGSVTSAEEICLRDWVSGSAPSFQTPIPCNPTSDTTSRSQPPPKKKKQKTNTAQHVDDEDKNDDEEHDEGDVDIDGDDGDDNDDVDDDDNREDSNDNDGAILLRPKKPEQTCLNL